MLLSEQQKTKFEPCPEYTGRAVCVDVTPLKMVTTPFGEKEKFRLVFEVDLEREFELDGVKQTGRWCVWSYGFTPSLHENSGFRKFLKQWFGRDLTDQEKAQFDTESLVGQSAFIVVIHNKNETGEETYANIAACTPLRGAEPLNPSGKYKRVKDREVKQYGQPAVAPTLAVPSIKRPEVQIVEFTDLLMDVDRKEGKSASGPWKAGFLTFNSREERPGTLDEALILECERETGHDVRVKMKPGRKEGTWELISLKPLADFDEVPF